MADSSQRLDARPGKWLQSLGLPQLEVGIALISDNKSNSVREIVKVQLIYAKLATNPNQLKAYCLP